MTEAAARRLIGRVQRGSREPRIDVDALARSQYSYDASNYRVSPVAVGYPRDVTDVVAMVRAAREEGVAITCRGRGTSMAGNAVGSGLIIDFSRHMTALADFDPAAGTVTVQPGVVLDDLQLDVAPSGLMFGPDPSSHSRATLGGMLGNDACGNHSVAYGRTSDHVRELEIVLADGTRAVAGRGYLRGLNPADADRVADLESSLRAFAAARLFTIRREFGRLPRQVSGYQLHHLLPENGFDVARALVGSEGTLAVVTSAKVGLVNRPAAADLVVLGYDDLVAAARDVPEILGAGPIALEAMDVAIVETLRARRGSGRIGRLPTGDAWLYVEFDQEGLGAKLVAQLQAGGRCRSARQVSTAEERAELWRIREDGAGLAARLADGTRTWPGWEDAAVAPDALATYLAEFRDLLAEHRYRGVVYGHFGAGCVHVRINFDLETPAGRTAMRTFLDAAARLVARYGGSLSGEHGDGRARSELLGRMYSPEALECLRALKALLDPSGVLNPGIIVDPMPVDVDMTDPPTPLPSNLRLRSDADDLGRAASRCVGIARCVARTGGAMCPSYRATGEERDSPRGRARALQELARGGVSTTALDEVISTLDLCLSCKACSTDCPTGTDVATYKSEVLNQRYRGRRRPVPHYSLGWLPSVARVASWCAGPVNAALRCHAVRRSLPTIAGVTSKRVLPAFASRRRLRSTLRATTALRAGAEPRAVLFVDTFTRRFQPDLALAAARVLTHAGAPIVLAPDVCCGLTWITTGQFHRARTMLTRLVDALNRPEVAELPVVVLEPSCASALAEDLPRLIDSVEARSVASRVRTFSAALDELAVPDWSYPDLPPSAIVQTHCHEYSTFGATTLPERLRAHGCADLEVALGCCGLAGNFGFEASHYELSIQVGHLALVPALARHPERIVLADGFGCRAQIEHLAPGRSPRHLAEVLSARLGTRSAHRPK